MPHLDSGQFGHCCEQLHSDTRSIRRKRKVRFLQSKGMTLPCTLPSFLSLPGVPRHSGVVLVLRKKAIAECKQDYLKWLGERSDQMSRLVSYGVVLFTGWRLPGVRVHGAPAQGIWNVKMTSLRGMCHDVPLLLIITCQKGLGEIPGVLPASTGQCRTLN